MKICVGYMGNAEDSRALYFMTNSWRRSKVAAIYYPTKNAVEVMPGYAYLTDKVLEALRTFKSAEEEKKRAWITFPVGMEYW